MTQNPINKNVKVAKLTGMPANTAYVKFVDPEYADNMLVTRRGLIELARNINYQAENWLIDFDVMTMVELANFILNNEEEVESVVLYNVNDQKPLMEKLSVAKTLALEFDIHCKHFEPEIYEHVQMLYSGISLLLDTARAFSGAIERDSRVEHMYKNLECLKKYDCEARDDIKKLVEILKEND